MKYDRSELDSFENGYTNKVFLTRENTVFKLFEPLSPSALLHFVRELILVRELPTVWDRIKAEIEVRDNVSAKYYAEVLDVGNNWLEFELVEGIDLNNLLETDCDAFDLGVSVGEAMYHFHESGVYLMDWALDDLILTDSGLKVIDFEFGGKNTSKYRKSFDKASILSQAGNLDNETYESFMEGIRTELSFSRKNELFGLFISFLFNLIYVWDQGKPRKVLEKIRNV